MCLSLCLVSVPNCTWGEFLGKKSISMFGGAVQEVFEEEDKSSIGF